jgi:hypothetical protein
MIDLESGLNYMLRHEIPHIIQVIQGEDLVILKKWLNVLTKVCFRLFQENRKKM